MTESKMNKYLTEKIDVKLTLSEITQIRLCLDSSRNSLMRQMDNDPELLEPGKKTIINEIRRIEDIERQLEQYYGEQ